MSIFKYVGSVLWHKICGNNKLVYLIKLLLCLSLAAMACKVLSMQDLGDYYSYRDYSYQNNFSTAITTENMTEVCQGFTAKGNILNNITVYLDEIYNQDLTFSIENDFGRTISSVTVNTVDHYNPYTWNTISIDCDKLERNREYKLKITSPEGLDSICVVQDGERPEIFTTCIGSEGVIEGELAIGFQFTDKYLLLGSIFQFGFNIGVIFLLTYALCYTIYKYEDIYHSLVLYKSKHAVWYALFFSVSFVLFCNPLESMRNEVLGFERVIGHGIVANVDVSRRIRNFSIWFIMFAVTFFLFFMLTNYLLQRTYGDESKKVVNFLDNLIVVADVGLAFRCITYFYDYANSSTIFYYSFYLLTAIIIVAIAYLIVNLERYISAELYSLLIIIAFSIAYPVTILSQKEWLEGRLLLGIQTLGFILIIVWIRFGVNFWNNAKALCTTKCFALFVCLFPFITSFYIELINVLNQHSIFVAYPCKTYFIMVIFAVLVLTIFTLTAFKKKWEFVKWKKWVYPCLIFGISCLSVQIPLEGTYNINIVEGANYSILISDFLNFGSIPLVEHYGGHMMSEVWEGIIYAILNNDIDGAVFSPYSPYVLTLLSVLFFYFIKHIWNEDMAILVALTFPFYNFWNYFGLGMLLCLAAISYIEKNSYPKACVVWSAFAWCAVYRLDLGFAYGAACIIVLSIYIIVYRNWRAVKPLVLSLVGFVITGGIIWLILCLSKGINPIDRMLEFLMLSLSNANWAYDNIGNMNTLSFSWVYIFIPFSVIVFLIYTVFSKNMRERVGQKRWIILLIMGFSYLANFSRGLVRHSLVETYYPAFIWTGYIFVSTYISCYKNNRKLFLPSFAILIFCNSLLFAGGYFDDVPVVDAAAVRTGTHTDLWFPDRCTKEEITEDQLVKTYWTEKAENAEPVERIRQDITLKQTIKPYQIIMDALLEENETFVDFTNKTFVYSAIKRKNPVYVSQSPLQLSDEFTQEMFIKEMNEMPLILIPITGEWSDLDEISNMYRYYKVAEYIYQNYIPLCRYENSFAVWCLRDRYDKAKAEIDALRYGNDYINGFSYCQTLIPNSCELEWKDEQMVISSNGDDPFFAELQTFIDIEPYINGNTIVSIDYDTDTEGAMEIYYTTEEGEAYIQNKMVSANISETGTAQFMVPVTEYTRLRLDIPENSTVKISSIRMGFPYEIIEYGYDGPILNDDGMGNSSVAYIDAFHHNYSLNHLSRIWAEKDKYQAANNPVVMELTDQNNIFTFNQNDLIPEKKGNYLLIKATYGGDDIAGNYKSDDETIDATVKVGIYNNGTFKEKYQFNIILNEGEHEYLIRISADYYWYLKEVNAVCIQTSGILHNVAMCILEGD